MTAAIIAANMRMRAQQQQRKASGGGFWSWGKKPSSPAALNDPVAAGPVSQKTTEVASSKASSNDKWWTSYMQVLSFTLSADNPSIIVNTESIVMHNGGKRLTLTEMKLVPNMSICKLDGSGDARLELAAPGTTKAIELNSDRPSYTVAKDNVLAYTDNVNVEVKNDQFYVMSIGKSDTKGTIWLYTPGRFDMYTLIQNESLSFPLNRMVAFASDEGKINNILGTETMTKWVDLQGPMGIVHLQTQPAPPKPEVGREQTEE